MISIIIPTYREHQRLIGLVRQLEIVCNLGHEIIVVNGDMADEASQVMTAPGVVVLHSEKGRAKQMNAGAQKARGDIYWFLHADSDFLYPLEHYLALILMLDKQQWGRFQVKLDAPGFIYRVIEFMINLRSSLSGLSTGDQSLFLHRELFDSVGGFTDIEIMEDVDMCRKLRKASRPVIAREYLITSARRWQTRGVLSTIWLMWKLRLYYFLGVAPEKLAKLYE